MDEETASKSIYIIGKLCPNTKNASRVRLAPLNCLVEAGEGGFGL